MNKFEELLDQVDADYTYGDKSAVPVIIRAYIEQRFGPLLCVID